MFTTLTILLILLFHWVFDFVFQTHEQSIHKSTSNGYLIAHTVVYSISWIVGSMIILALTGFPPSSYNTTLCIVFGLITFVSHTITDYYTSRANKLMYEKNDIHNFFVGIGFDQYLHYIQLFLTYYFLFLT